MSTKVIFRRAKVFVLAEVCLLRRPHAQTPSPLRQPLHEIFAFLSNIRPRLTCMRTSRKTSTRLKITFVDMTYPKGWTGSLPLCPLIFSWGDRSFQTAAPVLWNSLPASVRDIDDFLVFKRTIKTYLFRKVFACYC